MWGASEFSAGDGHSAATIYVWPWPQALYSSQHLAGTDTKHQLESRFVSPHRGALLHHLPTHLWQPSPSSKVPVHRPSHETSTPSGCVMCQHTTIIVRTIASFLVVCGADPVVALAAWTVELPRVRGLADADAAVALAPPAADLAIRCLAAAQGRLCGQLTYTTHLTGGKKKKDGQLLCSFGNFWGEGSSVLPPVSVWPTKYHIWVKNTFGADMSTFIHQDVWYTFRKPIYFVFNAVYYNVA